jgi:hypothetical protein
MDMIPTAIYETGDVLHFLMRKVGSASRRSWRIDQTCKARY